MSHNGSMTNKTQSWKKLTSSQKKFAVGALGVHFLIVGITHRDIMMRPDEQIRGSKRMWRLLTTANSMFSPIYYAIGRRTPASDE